MITSIPQQAADIRIRMKADMIKTIREHQGRSTFVHGPMIDALVQDAMHHIEPLLLLAAAAAQEVNLDEGDVDG